MVGLRVGKYLDLFAGMDITKVTLRDIGSNPDGMVKRNRQNRITRRDNRAWLLRACDHNTVGGRMDFRIVKIGLGRSELRLSQMKAWQSLITGREIVIVGEL